MTVDDIPDFLPGECRRAYALRVAVMWEDAIAMEARQRTDREAGLDPKGDSAGRQASPTRPHHPPEGE